MQNKHYIFHVVTLFYFEILPLLNKFFDVIAITIATEVCCSTKNITYKTEYTNKSISMI